MLLVHTTLFCIFAVEVWTSCSGMYKFHNWEWIQRFFNKVQEEGSTLNLLTICGGKKCTHITSSFPPLQIFTFASLKDLLLRIYDCITHGSDQNLGLQVTTFGGRDVACKKTEEGEGSRTIKNWMKDWSPDFRYQQSQQDRSSSTCSSQNNPTSFPAQDPASSQGHSEEEASFRPFLGFRVSKATKKRLGEKERGTFYICICSILKKPLICWVGNLQQLTKFFFIFFLF